MRCIRRRISYRTLVIVAAARVTAVFAGIEAMSLIAGGHMGNNA